MDNGPTRPEKAEAKGVVLERGKPVKLTPSGYPAWGLQARDGTRYEVLPSGQIVRRDGGKLTKAERKAAKKNRAHRLKTCATGMGK